MTAQVNEMARLLIKGLLGFYTDTSPFKLFLSPHQLSNGVAITSIWQRHPKTQATMGRVIRNHRKSLTSEERIHQGKYKSGRKLNTVSGKTRLLGAVYNASDSELVGTNTLVKSAIVQVDAAPFKNNNEVTGEFKNLEPDQMEKIGEIAREELGAEVEAELSRLNIQ
ncbi:unnamed protein product [Microthlaspi erraticum]|uniref:Uncharacterized protein n=1 Tax=Microthlaspi erraticum TaxID=1685480 RepID=A0A6D2KJT5_9BRAS|nr:unnamed protein product [Microthlaspi erraticum]